MLISSVLMKYIRQLAVFAIVMPLIAAPSSLNANADSNIAVVANRNSKITDLSKQQVAELYLGKRKTLHDDITVISVDSNEGDIRERFYQLVADMTIVRLNAYWSRIVFSGQGRPPAVLSLQEAVARVANDPNAIAYFSSEHIAADMKVLLNIQ